MAGCYNCWCIVGTLSSPLRVHYLLPDRIPLVLFPQLVVLLWVSLIVSLDLIIIIINSEITLSAVFLDIKL